MGVADPRTKALSSVHVATHMMKRWYVIFVTQGLTRGLIMVYYYYYWSIYYIHAVTYWVYLILQSNIQRTSGLKVLLPVEFNPPSSIILKYYIISDHECTPCINTLMLNIRVILEIIVWIFDTFDNKIGNEKRNDFTKK